MITSSIGALLIGMPKPFRADGTQSAMAREATVRPVMLTKNGFVGDQVADLQHHGGSDKALHLYPAEHYAFWLNKTNGHPLFNKAGAFGENIAAFGMTEEKIRIGDQFRFGNAVVEISHGRKPCWKIDHHFGIPGMAAEVVRTGFCGLYFRVIEDGEVAAGDTIQQVYAVQHDWTVQRVFKMLVAGGHRVGVGDSENASDNGSDISSALLELSELPSLASVWRERAATLLAQTR